MKRFLSVILILLFALQMPCFAEADGIEVGAIIAVDNIAVAEDEAEPNSVETANGAGEETDAPAAEKAADTPAVEEVSATEEAAPDVEKAAADVETPAIDTEVAAAPIDTNVPETEADLSDVPGIDLESSEAVAASEMMFGNSLTYSITYTGDGHGSIIAKSGDTEVSQAAENTQITLVINPDEGCELSSLVVLQGEAPVTVTGNKFTMPAGPVTVTATFAMTWAYVRNQLKDNNYVSLTTNVTRGSEDETIEVAGRTNCTLDLNGHTLDNGENSNPAIRVGDENAKLTITDSSTEKTGEILYRSSNTAIEVKYRASLTLAGGSIANANPDSRQGKGVKCEGDNSLFNMEGGSITGFDTAVNMEYDARFTLSGGKISAYNTCVVCNNRSTLTMSGGTITGFIHGVYLASTSTMTMTGGIITQNQSIGVKINHDTTLSVSGSPVITGDGNWWSNGVNLSTGRVIAVTGALGESAQIGVKMDTPGVCVVGSGGYTLTEDDLTHFSSDDAECAIVMNAEGKGEMVRKPVPDASPDPVPAAPTTPSTPEAPTQLSVTKKNTPATAFLGTTYQIVPGGGTGTKFKSSNKKVATVDQNGLITPHKPGKAKITFKVGKKKRTVTLRVKDPTVPTSVSFSPVNRTVKKGDSVTLTPVIPDGTNAGGFKWKSSNKKVAKVDRNGVVTFKKAGKVTITATAKRGKKKAKIRFKVGK